MPIDSNLNRLLWKWGGARTSESLKASPPPTSHQYVAPASTELVSRYDSEEVEALGKLIDENLTRRQTEALKCKYRYTKKGKPLSKYMSAKHFNCTVRDYMEYFNSAIRKLERGMAV